jgi:hypothetical protein
MNLIIKKYIIYQLSSNAFVMVTGVTSEFAAHRIISPQISSLISIFTAALTLI